MDGGSGGGIAQGLAQLAQQLLVHRVALLGPVQHDVADMSAILGDDHAHEILSISVEGGARGRVDLS